MPGEPAPPASPSVFAHQPRVFWVAVASALLLLIGAFGPWARVFFISVSGVDGGDGWVVVLAALVAGAMLYLWATRPRRWAALVAAAAGVVALLVFLVDGSDIFGTQRPGTEDIFGGGGNEGGLFGDADLVSPGWGLILVGLSSATLIASSLMLASRTQRLPGAP